ncbi:MAG: glycosyltransferase, partial [Phycisphaerae bacterium]
MTNPQPERHFHFDRLFYPGEQPWYVRTPARTLCHVAVRLLLLVASLFKRVRGSRAPAIAAQPARVVVTGSFFADNWVEAHIRPLATASFCEHVWAVSDHPFVPIAKVTYVCPPRWLQRVVGRVPARSLLFAITAVRRRATVVGGFHLLFNGLLALAVARTVGAWSMWFCVGGWAEFVNGGIHGGNHIFNKIARKDPSLERLLVSAIHQFDLILTMGTGARECLRNSGVNGPIEVMSGGIDQQLFTGSHGRRRYDLITVSRIAPVKRLDVFLEVVHRVAGHIPTVRAAIVGDGEELERLIHKSEAMGLGDNVSFVGRKTDVHRWLTDARLFVLTSDSEGLALALMEAMMAGLPAVVSDVGDLGDLVQNDVNGWRVRPGAVEDFAERITTLLTDEQLYCRFASEAKGAAMRHEMGIVRNRWDSILEHWGFYAGSPSIIPQKDGRRFIQSRKQLWESTTEITGCPTARVFSSISPQLWLGRQFRRNLDFVTRAQHWSRDEAASYQLRMLQHVISLAYERSPYYRQLYRACGFEPGDLQSLDDMKELPTVNGQEIQDHLQSMCTVQMPGRSADFLSTGGTSGRPFHFFINANRSETEYAYLVASWQRIGYTLHTPLAVLRGRVVSENRNGLHHVYEPMLRHHHYSTFHMTDENIRKCLEHVRSIGPCLLHAYPSAVMALARHVRRSGIIAPDN